VLGGDGSFSMNVLNKEGSKAADGPQGTWRFEDGQIKLEYGAKCEIDAKGGKAEGVVGVYEVHYRMMGGDKPARLYFTPVGDQCLEHRTNWRRDKWSRVEP
jgi:hypothetical protein